MHETTQIAVGNGNVSITVNSETTSEVKAPDIRFGDYNMTATSCFSVKEMEQIANGKSAEVVITYIMSDEPENGAVASQFNKAIEAKEKEIGALNKGVYFEVSASKSIDGSEPVVIDAFYEPVEMQIDIPLYLVEENRSYYIMNNVMGACVLYEDIEEEADSLTISVLSIGDQMMLYQNNEDKISKPVGGIGINTKFYFVAGVVLLIAIRIVMDFRNRKDK